jgi:hypothetical protein
MLLENFMDTRAINIDDSNDERKNGHASPSDESQRAIPGNDAPLFDA